MNNLNRFLTPQNLITVGGIILSIALPRMFFTEVEYVEIEEETEEPTTPETPEKESDNAQEDPDL